MHHHAPCPCSAAARAACPCPPAAGPQRAHERFAVFYDRLYSVCGDREALLATMLARKQQFAEQALRGMLHDELGVRSARFA